MTIAVPEFSLVVLMGPSGSGRSTFARRHFEPSEVLASDSALELEQRLAQRAFTVIDAPNVQPEARKPLVAAARRFHCAPAAIVLDLPESICDERNAARSDRTITPRVVRHQIRQLHRSLPGLEREGFRHVFTLSSPEDVASARIERQLLANNRRACLGPFDIIGDVHGCRSELDALLRLLGYDLEANRHPEGRKAIFLGDLVHRGPDVPGVLRVVMSLVENGSALCVSGNHDAKLLKKLRGRDVQVSHGLEVSLAQLAREPAEFHTKLATFLDALVSHYVLDEGRLVVAHAGLKESMQGRESGKVLEFALYGETTGETDAFGLPVRHNWAAEYRGSAMVVYGHTPVREPVWLNGTINVDTGCVFGGRLSALRYPEKELVSVPAERVWCEPTQRR